MSFAKYFSVIILCVINLLNFMDRYTIAGVLTDIEDYYDLSNAKAGLLQTSFILSYLIFAPIFGFLGDRYSRKYIIMGGVTFWSVTTLAGSFIPQNHSYVFFVLRALVGIGEASYSTISPTLIADLFEREKRTRVLAIFYLATPVGAGLGYLMGSGVAHLFNGWQWALRVTPPLGIISVILVWISLTEPPRGHSDGIVGDNKSNIIADLKYLIKIKSYIYTTVGFTCITFTIGALAWWMPTYAKYAYQMHDPKSDTTSVSFIFGAITCIAGIVGVVSGSGCSQYFRKSYPKADPFICAFGILLGVPFLYGSMAITVISPIGSWVLLFFAELFLCSNWAIITDITLYVIVPHRRSIAQAILISVSHLLGDACSPYIVGEISDAFSMGDNSIETKYKSLQNSVYIISLTLLIGVYAFIFCTYYVIEDKEKCVKSTYGNDNSSVFTIENDETTVDASHYRKSYSTHL